MGHKPHDGGVELIWPGKYDAAGNLVQPTDIGASIERRTTHGDPTPNRLILGDNLAVMQALCRTQAGTIDLIYIDPPFATGGKFSVLTQIGDETSPEGIREVRTVAYDDAWPGGFAGFLQMLAPRIRLLHQLLSPTGSMYIHVDPTVGHAVKLLTDEVFGPGCFQREIVWRIGWLSGFKTKAKNWIRNHDLIFFYTKDPRKFTFNKHYVPHAEGYRRRDGKKPTSPGMPIEDVWNANASEFELRGADSLDSIQIKSFSTEKTGWATQKNQSLLRRIIEASSNPGDTVLDVFCGSGTTAVVAASLGRHFIACDTSQTAVHITRKRLLMQPSPVGFAVEALDGRECRLVATEGWETRIIRHHGGVSPSPGTPVEFPEAGMGEASSEVVRETMSTALHGVVEGTNRGILLQDPASGWTSETLVRAIAMCKTCGYKELDILSWDPVPDRKPSPESDIRVHAYRLGRELLDPRFAARPGSGITPRAAVVATVERLSEHVCVTLVGLRYATRHRLPEPIEVAVADPLRPSLDAVDAWGVDSEHPDAPGTWVPHGFVFRSSASRTLPTQIDLPHTRGRVRLRVTDVLGRLNVWVWDGVREQPPPESVRK